MRKNSICAAFVWALCCALCCAPVVAAEPGISAQRYIMVSGEASQDFVPDQAKVVLSVVTQGRAVSEATRENNRRMAAVMDALRKHGVTKDQIRTVEFLLEPKYAAKKSEGYDPDEMRKITGYEATNTLEVTLNAPEKVAALIDAAMATGADKVGNVRFTLSREAELQDQVFALAVRNALRRAGDMAKVAHMHLGPVLQIEDSLTGRGRLGQRGSPRTIVVVQNKAVRNVGMKILPGRISLEAQATLWIALK